MVRYTSCRCVFHLLNRAGFVFTTGENPLSQRARLVCWAQSPSCHSAVVVVVWGKVSPQSALKAIACPPPVGVLPIAKALL